MKFSRRSWFRWMSLSGMVPLSLFSNRAAPNALSVAPADASAHQARFRPVRTLNGWSLPHRLVAGVKEFHLVAEEIEHEFAPGCVAKCWGYNGSTPGPTLEAVEGDRVRIFVTNRLPEHTSVHWHGIILPSGNGHDGAVRDSSQGRRERADRSRLRDFAAQTTRSIRVPIARIPP